MRLQQWQETLNLTYWHTIASPKHETAQRGSEGSKTLVNDLSVMLSMVWQKAHRSASL